MYYRKANSKNFSQIKRSLSNIHYIVVHYTAGKKDTARNNVDAFATHITKTSAHFFVDEKEVAQSVPVDHPAWHCGGEKYKNGAPAPFYGKCLNANSIGVEMCSRFIDGNFYIPEDTRIRTARFVAELMRKYKVPIKNVIRHYDVTGKYCPEPWIRNPREWDQFKDMVSKIFYEMEDEKHGEVQEEKDQEGVQEEMKYYETLDQIPAGEMREVVKKLIDRGTIKGTCNGLHLSEDMVRMMVYNDREGLYK